jgi:hypothetical protein
MTKQEKIVSLGKHLEKTKRALEKDNTSKPLKEFLEREVKRTETKISSLK